MNTIVVRLSPAESCNSDPLVECDKPATTPKSIAKVHKMHDGAAPLTRPSMSKCHSIAGLTEPALLRTIHREFKSTQDASPQRLQSVTENSQDGLAGGLEKLGSGTPRRWIGQLLTPSNGGKCSSAASPSKLTVAVRCSVRL